MNHIIILLLIYLVIILIVLTTYFLVSKLLRLYFNKKKEPSLAEPIIKGLSILGAVYAGRNELALPILNTSIQLVNVLFKIQLTEIKETETQARTFETIALFVIVGIVLIVYTLVAFKRKVILNQEVYLSESEPIKIVFPKEETPISPIFHERVKLLFELKFEREKLKLTFDKVDAILYGDYIYGLHSYFVIIFCHDCIINEIISADQIIAKKKQLDRISEKLGYHSTRNIIECYYVIENGKFETKENSSLICYAEDDCLNELIDFSGYLKKLINKFDSDKLPFSSADKEDDKYTLSQTFIQPNFQVSGKDPNNNLEQHVDAWLQQSNRKHMLILGDYGMGKSTFMKYYANHLSKNILEKRTIERFPVFISLTNTSPRHGGIDNAIGKFVSDNLAVSRARFDTLVNRGKIVFLLDGFDEMGYVGTHEQRMKQLNAIWQIATKNNKLIISGRPSYFPTEKELIDSFNVKNADQEFTPLQDPYFEEITLDGFNDEQVKQSISLYRFSDQDKQNYIKFIFSNQNILDLCKRPSMMHIIREMLQKLYAEHEAQNLNPSNLMRQYIDHWISRQLEKNIVSAVEDKRQKREFVWEFFSSLARIYYVKKIESMPSNEISQIISNEIQKLKLIDESDIDGIETELLSGFFIEIGDTGYKFVHKSFKEFFISSEIINLLKNKKFDDPLVSGVDWSKEINDFVFDGYSQSKEILVGQEQVPYLWSWYGFSSREKLFLKRLTRIVSKIYKHSNGPQKKIFNQLIAASVMFNPLNLVYIYIGLFLRNRLTKNSNVDVIRFILRSYYYCYLKDNSLMADELIKSLIQAYELRSKKTLPIIEQILLNYLKKSIYPKPS